MFRDKIRRDPNTPAKEYFREARKQPKKKIEGTIVRSKWDKLAAYAGECGCPKSRVVETLIEFAVDKVLAEAEAHSRNTYSPEK